MTLECNYKKNYTVKQHENHPSGTWGYAEQESGGGVRKLFDLICLLIFKMSIKAIEIAFVEMLNKNLVELAENNLI